MGRKADASKRMKYRADQVRFEVMLPKLPDGTPEPDERLVDFALRTTQQLVREMMNHYPDQSALELITSVGVSAFLSGVVIAATVDDTEGTVQ